MVKTCFMSVLLVMLVINQSALSCAVRTRLHNQEGRDLVDQQTRDAFERRLEEIERRDKARLSFLFEAMEAEDTNYLDDDLALLAASPWPYYEDVKISRDPNMRTHRSDDFLSLSSYETIKNEIIRRSFMEIDRFSASNNTRT